MFAYLSMSTRVVTQAVTLLFVALISCSALAAPPKVLPGELTLEPSDIASPIPGWSYSYREDPEDPLEVPLTGYLLVPEGAGPYPAVVASHGKGGNAIGFLQVKGVEWFVPAGYAVIAPELTHAGQVSCAEESSQCGGHAENVHRAQRAYDILSSQQLIDALGMVIDRRNILLYGNSLGALTSIEFAEVIGSKVRAVAISAGGIIHRNSSLVYMTPNGIDGVSQIHAPMMQLHGRNDRVVYYNEAVILSNELEALGKKHQTVYFPLHGHNIAQGDLTGDVVKDFVLTWFATHLDRTEPYIQSMDVSQGSVDDLVTLTGSNFGLDDMQNSEVMFKLLPATKVYWDDTTIQVLVPSGAKSGAIQVVKPVGPIDNEYVTQPVVGGVRSNRVMFTIIE